MLCISELIESGIVEDELEALEAYPIEILDDFAADASEVEEWTN